MRSSGKDTGGTGSETLIAIDQSVFVSVCVCGQDFTARYGGKTFHPRNLLNPQKKAAGAQDEAPGQGRTMCCCTEAGGNFNIGLFRESGTIGYGPAGRQEVKLLQV